MLEVRLDNPVEHILNGGEGLVTHGGNGSRCYAQHVDDPKWAIVHIEDEDWIAMNNDGLYEEGRRLIASILSEDVSHDFL